MPTVPDLDEPQSTIVERVRQVMPPKRQWAVIALAISAGLAALSPFPAGPIAASIIVLVAADRGKR